MCAYLVKHSKEPGSRQRTRRRNDVSWRNDVRCNTLAALASNLHWPVQQHSSAGTTVSCAFWSIRYSVFTLFNINLFACNCRSPRACSIRDQRILTLVRSARLSMSLTQHWSLIIWSFTLLISAGIEITKLRITNCKTLRHNAWFSCDKNKKSFSPGDLF